MTEDQIKIGDTLYIVNGWTDTQECKVTEAKVHAFYESEAGKAFTHQREGYGEEREFFSDLGMPGHAYDDRPYRLFTTYDEALAAWPAQRAWFVKADLMLVNGE